MTRLMLVLGPGGVGKTTVSAALAVALAESGARVAVITVDPAKRLAQALGRTELPSFPEPVTDLPELHAGTLDRCAAWAAMLERCVRAGTMSASEARELAANPYWRRLQDDLPSSAEFIASDYILELLAEGTYDAVVVDTPPADDALAFLDAPERLARFLDGRIVGLLLGGGGNGVSRRLVLNVLRRLAGGQMLDDMLVFLRLMDGVFAYINRRGKDFAAARDAAGTRRIIVGAPDRQQGRSCARFVAHLGERNLAPSHVVLNRMAQPLPPADALVCSDPELANWTRAIAARRQLAEARDLRRASELVAAVPGVPVARVAALAEEPSSLADLRTLAAQLREVL